MSTPTTYQQFVAQLAESSLLSAADVETVVSGLPKERRPKDGEQLARELVRHNKLTVYQAQQVYAGKAKELVRGNYVILDKLGKGGMGVVYKAEHKRMHRLVALKVLSTQAMKSPDAVKRFHREVEAAAKLNHPHIVAAYDADEAGGTHFLVMEYVEGDDLANTVRKLGPLPIDKGVSYILQAARGLEFAHQRGVIHRDIKPANMLLDADGNVKILDMGLARFESDVAGEAELTNTGQVMGTVDYMAPEQALSTKQADQRSDIYSLGMSLWFVLTGQACYGGDSLMARMLAHREQPIPSLSKACKDAPKQLEQVFAKMIAKNAKDRYQSMSEVVAALETCRPGSVERTEPQVKKDEDRLLGAVLRENAHPSQMKLPVAQPLPPVKTAPSIVTAKPPAARKEAGAAGSAPAKAAAPPPARSRTSMHAVDDTMNTGAPSGSTSSQLQQLFNVAAPTSLPASIAKKKPQPWWQDKRMLLFGGIGAAVVAAVLLLGIAGIAFLITSPETETAGDDSTTTTTGDNGAGAIPPVTPPSTSSSIVVLDELGASPFHMAPWPSSDGLRLYYEGFTGKGTSGHGVLMASRSSVGGEFGEPVFVFDARHPCFTDDELELFCIGHDTPAPLLTTRRVSRDGTFAPATIMFERSLDKVLDSNVKSPFISGDGKMLVWQREPDSGRGIEFAVLHRVSRDARWALPPNAVKVFNEKARGKPPTWPWVSADNMFTVWSHGGDRNAEIWTARRRIKGVDYSDFAPLLVDGKPLVGRSPRWCEKTGELFFSQPIGGSNWQLAVLKDFWPQGRPASASPPATPPQGFTALFNSRDLSGWEVMQSSGNGANDQSVHVRGSGGWDVAGGVLRCTTGVPGWLKTVQQFENFVLQLEYRLPLSSSNSGIYIRAPDVGHLSNVGMEVQIHEGTTQTGEQTGAIHRAATGVGKQPHPGRAAGNPARADGLWNQLEISCQGDIVQTKLNGDSIVATSMATNPALRDRPRKGFIGLANWMGQAQGVEFRNIWIKQLAASAASTPPVSTPPATTGAGWQPLFPGDDITAWKAKSGMWSMKSGDLTGTPSAPPSYSFLFSPKPYADFELQFQARVRNDQDNSGVQIRSEVLNTTEWSARGPQCEVGGAAAWGGLYGEQLQVQGGWLVKPTGSPAIKRDEFNDYFIRCVGKHVTIKVNDVTTVDADVPSMADAGLIAFQVHRRNTADVTFRNIQIRELGATAPPAEPEIVGAATFNGHQYKYFPEVLSWKEARDKCVALGGDLVVIESADENWFVAQHIEAAGGIEAWIGATDADTEDAWTSPSGARLAYTNWAKGQPNNKNSAEHFALVIKAMNWMWSDQPMTALQHRPGYVCEWAASPATPPEAAAWRNLAEADFVNVNTAADTWKWVGGQLHCTGTPHGVLRTKDRFTDFEFAVEWRHMKSAGNSGAFVWVGDGDLAGLKPGDTPTGGIELQMLDHGFTEEYKRTSGGQPADWFTTHGDVIAIGKTAMQPLAPVSPRGNRSLPKKQLSKPAGEWNQYLVRCVGGEVRLSVNGEEVSGGSGISPATGYIGLQAEGSPIEFRNLRVREIGAASTAGDGWIDLFNGRDLAGWQEIGTQEGWVVDKGVLVADGKAKSARQAGWLMTEREFANFELQLEFSIDERTDSGVAFRCDPALTTGNSQAEIQIVDQADAEFIATFDRQQHSRTGSLAGLASDRALPAVERDQWHAMKVVVKDRRVQATVDGVVTVDTDLDKHLRAQPSRAGVTRATGPIGLQRLVGGVRYRNIRIRDLGGAAAVEPVVPQGWVELFNGKDLDNWTKTDGSPPHWRVFDKYVEVVKGGSIRTKAEFGPDFDLALEFWLPRQQQPGQARANSGVYLIGRHEVQICDAFNNNVPDKKQTCGAIYNLIAPEVDAIAPPETWQSFAIDYRAPRWLANGALAAEGHVAIFHNGKRIITDGKLTTAGNAGALFTTAGSRGPIVLQDHGNPVRFRNIRIREH